MSSENNNQAPAASAISADEEIKITEIIASMGRWYDTKIEPTALLRQALLNVLRRDSTAFDTLRAVYRDAMLTVHRDAFFYDGIQIKTGTENPFIDYFDLRPPLAENSLPKLTNALYAMARVTQRCVDEIAYTGGEKFARDYGYDIDIKAIFEGIKRHIEAGNAFDPSPSGMHIRFTGRMMYPRFLSPPAVQPEVVISPKPDADSKAEQVPAAVVSEEEGKLQEMAKMAFPHSTQKEAAAIHQALLNVLRRDPYAFAAMLTAYKGNFIYDGITIDAGTGKFFPEYFDIQFPLAGNIIPKLTNALYTMALTAQYCMREITAAGGGEAFARKHGRTLKIQGIFEGIEQHRQRGGSLDTALLKFQLKGTDLTPVFLPRPTDALVNLYPERPQEPKLENYRTVLPDDVRVAADADTPADFQGKRYIRIEESVYQVSFNEARDAWCILSEDRTQAPLAVDYQEGKWQPRAIGHLGSPPDISATEVPKNLHFVWLGKLGDIQQHYINTWINVNPEYQIRLWYDPHALLSHELGKRITASVLSQEQHLIYTTGYVDAILQLQNKAHDSISREMLQGQTFDLAAESFMREEFGVSAEELQRIRKENADSYQTFMQQHKDNPRITLADVNTVIGNNINREHYYRELSLRQILATSSDMVRLEALHEEGGIYLDADLLPRLNEQVFAAIRHPDLIKAAGRNRELIDFVKTRLVLEYLQQRGHFTARQTQVDAGQYNDFVKDYIHRDEDAAGIADRTRVIEQLREAIQQTGQAHSRTSLLNAFFLPLEPAISHRNIGKLAFVTGGINNSVIIAHRHSEALRRAFAQINTHYRILEQHGLIRQVSSKNGLIQRVDEIAATRFDEISSYEKILAYRLDGLTDERVTVYLTGPTMLMKIFRTSLQEKSPDPDKNDDEYGIPEELLFHDYNVATEEDAKSSWVSNDQRTWPFQKLILSAGIEERLRTAGPALQSAENKALQKLAALLKTFQDAQEPGEKINALVALDTQRVIASGFSYRGTSVDTELMIMSHQIGGMLFGMWGRDLTALVKAEGLQSEAKKSLTAFLERLNAFYAAPDSQKVAALFNLRKQLTNTLPLLPSAGNKITKILSVMQARIDNHLFSEDRVSPMSADIKEKLIRISSWSPERAAVIHYHADAALYGAAGYSSDRAETLASQEITAFNTRLQALREHINKLEVLVDRIWHGGAALNTEEQQLVSRFLDNAKIAALSGSKKNEVLYQAVQAMAEKYTANFAENLAMDEREAFRIVLEETIKKHTLSEQALTFIKKAFGVVVFKTMNGALGQAVTPHMNKWAWTQAQENKLREGIQKKLKNPNFASDAFESRWLIPLQGDVTTVDAAMSLFLKHFSNSQLILWSRHAKDSDRNISLRWDGQHLVQGPVSAPEKTVKILLVGHGTEEGTVFAGRSATMWQKEFRQMLETIPSGVEQIHITLAGCRLVNASSGSLPKQLADMLLARGRELDIAPDKISLSAHQNYMRVMENGRKEIYLNGQWISTASEVARSEGYKSTWHYDSNTQSMLSDMPVVKFYELGNCLWQGKVLFQELSEAHKSLVSHYLDDDQINMLSRRGPDGNALNQALHGMATHFAGSTENINGIPDGKAVLGSLMDTEANYWWEMGKTLGIAPDAKVDAATGKMIVSSMNHLQESGKTQVPGDSHTLRSLGFRARVLTRMQAFIGGPAGKALGRMQTVIDPASKGMLALGSVAALCRIKVINERLKQEALSSAEKAKLETEKGVALAELGVDLSDEAISLVNSKKIGINVIRVFKGTEGRGGAAIDLGKRLTAGLRVFASGAGVLLSLAGTALAWYGVHTALQSLQELKDARKNASTDKERASIAGQVTQMKVNLGVNIATAIIGTGLAIGSIVSLVAGIAGATSVLAVSTAIMSVAGPIGGAILVGAFIGLWIYNGIKTVQEFSDYMNLSDWDKFELGFGSIFGSIPVRLQKEYDFQKLRVAVAEAAQLERQGIFGSQPEIKTLYHFLPEVVPGKIHTEQKYVTHSVGGMPGGSYVSSERVDPPVKYQRPIDINMDRKEYVAISSAGKKVKLNPDEFISVRQTREVRNDIYQEGVILNLPVNSVIVPASVWGKKTGGAALSEKLSGKIHEPLLNILRNQSNARLFSADEESHLTLFCLHENNRKISFYKYLRQEEGSYSTDVSWTQPLPQGLQLPQRSLTGSGILFQDLDGDGLADLIAVNEEGQLQVARQQQDGYFALTEEFSIYRAKTTEGQRESLSLSGHRILGFGDTARTLYSQDNSSGVKYAWTVVSRVENQSDVSLVKLNTQSDKNKKSDKFIASAKKEAGDFVFHLGGGRKKEVKGGVNKDSFVLFDNKTYAVLDGGEGTDTLDLRQVKEDTVLGVIVNTPKGEASIKLKQGPARQKIVSFANIENITGTRGDDELTGDGKNNVIDGAGGRDIIDTGAGDDVIKGIQGAFKGGPGTDRYELGRVPTAGSTGVTATDLIEDYSKGEDSYVSLEYRIDEIKSIMPEGVHLLITLNDAVQYRLHRFYANEHTGADKKISAWHFTTRDGFSFLLKTAAEPPASKEALSGIVVSFDGTLKEEGGLTNIRFHARGDATGEARIQLSQQRAGKNVARDITLPAMFELELRSIRKKGEINEVNGSSLPELLTGGAGTLMRGKGGADTYIIEDSQGGVVEIDNYDATGYMPGQDTLILPWPLSETKLVVKDEDVYLSHSSQPENHVQISLSGFMRMTLSGLRSGHTRHLNVRDSLGQTCPLNDRDGVAYLASGRITMDYDDRLEVFSASQKNLTLDGSRRILTENSSSTVIIDNSGLGNTLQGTDGERNYLQVSGGKNILSGGRMADVFQGGTGKDHMEGKAGNDVYYVQGTASILDTEGDEDTLILMGAEGTAQEQLELEKREGALHIRLRNDQKRTVIIEGYYDNPGQEIEHIVMNGARLSGSDIHNLATAMADMRISTPDRDTWEKREALTAALGKWTSLVAAPMASSI